MATFAPVQTPANFTEQEAKLYLRLLFVAADSHERGTPQDLRIAKAALDAIERIEANVRHRERTERLHLVQGIA